MGFWSTITGVQGKRDREEAEYIVASAQRRLENYKESLVEEEENTKNSLECLGEEKLKIIATTVTPFIQYLEKIKNKSTQNEYDFLKDISITIEDINEMVDLSVSVEDIIGSSLVVGALGTIALTGVPTAVTGLVTAIGAASTGTAISSLSGVAASNAVLAWLGGGSLAAGGGGMALGATVLSGLTFGATAGVALVGAGLFYSFTGKKKLRKAEEFDAEVDIACEKIQAGIMLCREIVKYAEEQVEILNKLKDRINQRFYYFRPLLSDFNPQVMYQTEVFQACAILVKAVSEIARINIIDEEGNVNHESVQLNKSIYNLLETK